MQNFLDKISSYNLFNYLLPGIIFVIIADALTNFHFIQEDIIIGLFLYYFIGLIISRLGSIILEPIMKWSKFVKFAPYGSFVDASQKDKSLEMLSEANNMYRTFSSLFMSLIFLKIYERISISFPVVGQWATELLVVGMFVLFCFSYRKQTQYIRKRIQFGKEKGITNG